VRGVAVLSALALLIGACGSDPAPVRTEQAEGEVERHPLPLGLAQVEGTEPIGRPLVFEHVASVFDGQPVASTAVRAAYRVTGDPETVLRAWAEQLVPVGLGDVLLRFVEPQFSPAAWGEIGSTTAWGPGSPPPGFVDVQLWATESDPILLVSIDRHHGVEPVSSSLVDDGGALVSDPRQVGGAPPQPGDELFREQGSVIHVPEGARALMPTIPTMRGTGDPPRCSQRETR
jgi:hypothetical protein